MLLATSKVFNYVTSQYLQLACKGFLALILLEWSESLPDAQDAGIYSELRFIKHVGDAHMREVLKALIALQIGPYAVPKGTVVHVGLYTMHRDQRWWEDAEAFKPERWVGDETGGDKSGGLAYMPFGLGPRKCIGYKLAGEQHLHIL